MDKKVIKREDWASSFYLVGTPIINDEYTYKINERSNKSNWVYNSLNLGVDCGSKAGIVYCELMGGYSEDNENRIFAHGKKDDGKDDYSKQIIVDWEDRFNDDVLEEIGDMSFITVGLERTNKRDVFKKKFLSAYDAIAYVNEHLTSDMVVFVRGNLKYSIYNDAVQVKKNITSIELSIDNKTKEYVTPDKYTARFTQSVLLDKDSASLKDIDKDKGVMYVNARVLDYAKEINGIEVKGQYPFNKQFEFAMDFSKETDCKKIMDKLFKVKKGITQLTMEGEFVEGGAVVTATWDDVPDDIKDLVEMGIYDKEEALAKCTANGSRERRMVLKRPQIRLVGEDKVPVISRFEERYTEEDLTLDYLYDFNEVKDDEVSFDTGDGGSDDSMDWLNNL